MTTPEIIIRPAQPSDIEALRKLNTQIFEAINASCDSDILPRFSESEEGRAWMTKLVNRKNDGCCFVAERGGELVGYVSGEKLEQIYRKSRWFEIDNLGVIAEIKGHGIGKKLLEAALDWAKNNGYQKVHIICYAANETACLFYEHAGFNKVDVTFEKQLG